MGVIARLRKLEKRRPQGPFDAVEFVETINGIPEKPIPAARPRILRIFYDIVSRRPV